MTTELRRTPLYETHLAHSARMVDYAGWAMPVLYSGILEEARAVRNQTGIFDISHMGRTLLSGTGATALLQYVTSNDVVALQTSAAHYSLLTNPEGGIVDDIIVYRQAEEQYLVVINASNTRKDLDWITSQNKTNAALEDRTEETAMIAVQGPGAPAMVAKLAGEEALLEMKRFHYADATIAGAKVICCRTGYTGEDGFELILPAAQASEIWTLLIEAGAAPCGLGARDALRIEAGYPLYGHEIDDTTSPVEAGLMWVVNLSKGDFIGRDAISKVKEDGPRRRLMGLTSQDRIQPRQGYTIYAGDDNIGEITSGVFSPTRNHSLAMGYVDIPFAKAGNVVEVEIRGKRSQATLVPKKDLLKS